MPSECFARCPVCQETFPLQMGEIQILPSLCILKIALILLSWGPSPNLGSFPSAHAVDSHTQQNSRTLPLCSSSNPSSAITSQMRVCGFLFSPGEVFMTSSPVFQLFTLSSIMACLCFILYYSLRLTSYLSINCKPLESRIHDTPFSKSPLHITKCVVRTRCIIKVNGMNE